MTRLSSLQRPRGIIHQLSVVVVSAFALSLGSCTSNTPATNSASSQSATSRKELQVVTTFIPITDFTKAVAGDRAQVTQLLPTNVGPHDFQAKPEDAEKLAKADVLIENGLGMEEFLDDLVKNAGNANLKIIDSSKGVQTISTAAFEGKKQAQAKQIELNPHIWLDPKRAIHQVENIRDGLIAADPSGKEVYTANAAAYIAKLQQLDSEFTQKLQPFAGKTFVTYHDFAPYFAQSYHLKAQFLVGIPEENASPADVKRVIDSANNSKLKTLLTEPQAAGNPFSALAKDLHVQVGNFDPMETASGEGVQPDYYFTVMRQNLTNLETAFGSKSTQSFLPNPCPASFLANVPQPVTQFWILDFRF
ncbi:MAG: zinc ABC transporter substrate-binding protein [Nostoc sp.]|uniref:metal ABC transporter solute-binding protein, Zn/Mn family n=1 Tax=Nostoc sp. TaxID=1180 RepID=UPI002FFB97C2